MEDREQYQAAGNSGTSDGEKPARGPSINYCIRLSGSAPGRLRRLKVRLDTRSTTEVVRRALEVYERLLDAELVEIVEAGSRQRMMLP